jgi:hypothetical protein
MKIARLSFLLLGLTILLVRYVPAYGQIKDQKIFELIPATQRASFIARLNLYIDYSLRGQQTKLETLYDEDTLCGLCKGKRECIDNCTPPMIAQVPEGYSAVLVALRPLKVKPYTAATYWDYSIDAEQAESVSWRGEPPHVVKSEVRIFAVYKHGEWYFSLVSIQGMIWL